VWGMNELSGFGLAEMAVSHVQSHGQRFDAVVCGRIAERGFRHWLKRVNRGL